jgi:hypothetical protein
VSHWWTGIPTAEATISCGGHTHTLRWQAGELIALNHSDPDGETTLAADLADLTQLTIATR